MARKSLDDRLAELTRQRDQLEARRQSLLSSKKDADRKRDTRRKIVISGAVLAHAEANPAFADQLRSVLGQLVTRDLDREVIADLLSAPAKQAGAAA